MIDKKHTARIGFDVCDALQPGGALGFQGVHRQIEPITVTCEHDGDNVDPPQRVESTEYAVSDPFDALEAVRLFEAGTFRL